MGTQPTPLLITTQKGVCSNLHSTPQTPIFLLAKCKKKKFERESLREKVKREETREGEGEGHESMCSLEFFFLQFIEDISLDGPRKA